MKTLVALVVMHFSLFATSAKAAENDTTKILPAAFYLNVAYGSDSKQVMDIYLPADRSTVSTKVLIIIHGGSWSGGDKKGYTAYVDSLKDRLPGYAFVNVNYRLASAAGNKFPAQENDISMAMNFLAGKVAEYEVTSQVVLLGASAGAHLALLQAYKYPEPLKVKAVVSFFGPSDFNYMYNNPMFPQVPQLLEMLLNGSPKNNETIYHDSSPINYVTTKSCPTLLLQGGKDPLVNPKQSELLKAKLEKEHVTNQLVVYPNEGHGWRGANLSDSFDKIGVFLNEHVN